MNKSEGRVNMKIVRFDAPNHTFEEISIILSTIGYKFWSCDEIYWLIGIENDESDDKRTIDFFNAVGFKHVMVVPIDEYVKPSKVYDTITLTKYVLVYRMFDNRTFCYSATNPTFKAKVNADYIFAPGVYPVPMKDGYGIFSNSHPQIPSDTELMLRMMGR